MILSIETSTKVCSVALHHQGRLIDFLEDHSAFNHSVLLHSFVEDLLKRNHLKLNELEAIAISSGPGSYTGLRIGVSTAKGYAFALNKPLIAIPTLESLCYSDKINSFIELNNLSEKEYVFIPMIDARRMEVYACTFSSRKEKITETEAIILHEQSFSDKEKIKILIGDGAAKTKELFANRRDIFIAEQVLCSAKNLGDLAYQKWIKKEFENTAYFEPFYLKEFVALKKKTKAE